VLPSTGSNEIQQSRGNNSLGRVLRPGSLKALVVEMPVHPVAPASFWPYRLSHRYVTSRLSRAKSGSA